jgi:uncharacterized membrane protein YhaH (DUF805 family)
MKVTFVDAVRLGFVKFKVYRGTSSRREYWYFVLFSVLLGIVLSTIESIIWPQDLTADPIEALNQFTPLSNLAALILLLPTLALTSRRIRDAGWSGRWLLLFLLPFVTLAFGSFGLIEYLDSSVLAPQDVVAATLAYFMPTLLLAFGIQIFLLVLCILPSKSKEAGNRYAD